MQRGARARPRRETVPDDLRRRESGASLMGRWALVPALALLSAAGCESIVGGAPREEAHIRVESDDAAEVEVATSVAFIVQSGVVVLVEADTQRVALPHDEEIPFTESQRLYVSVGPVDGGVATVRMRVWVDEERWFDSERLVGGEEIPTMEFVYRYRKSGR